MNRDTQAVLARIATNLLDGVNDRAAAPAEAWLPFDGRVPDQRLCPSRKRLPPCIRSARP